MTAHRDTQVVSDKDLDLARANERLRRENRIPKAERDILKKAIAFFASQRFPINRLCQVMDVSSRGLRVYRSRQVSKSGKGNCHDNSDGLQDNQGQADLAKVLAHAQKCRAGHL